MISNKRNSRFSLPLLAGLAAATLTISVEAAWLKAFGTSEKEGPMTPMIPLQAGGYFITGSSPKSPAGSAYWYARVDEQGKVLWSKTSGDVLVSDLDGTGRLRLLQSRVENAETFVVNATGALDLSNGAISDIRVDRRRNVTGNGKKFIHYGAERGDLIVGTWQTAPANIDAALGKLGANNQLVWSHRYDYDGDDSLPTAHPMKQGYLLTFSNFDFSGGTFRNAGIFARLDGNGVIVAGTPKTITAGDGTVFIPNILEDDSIVLVGSGASANSQSGVIIIKLNGNLDVVWSKRLLGSASDQLTEFTVTETAGGALELLPSRRVEGTGNNLIEQHPLRIRLDRNTGALLEKKEGQIKRIDPRFFTPVSDGSYALTGTISETGEDSLKDGVFARFDGNLAKRWARSIAGAAYDHVSTVHERDGAPGFLLAGETESWGAGQRDLLFGRLDANGTVSGCPAIADVNPVLTDPDVRLEDFTPTVLPAQLTDNGSFNVTVVDAADTLAVNPVDFPLTATAICEAADSAAPGGNGSGGNPGNKPAPSPNGVSDTEVTGGDTLSISGSGFTSKRGKVLIGRKKAKILSWSDGAIRIKLPANLKAGVYTVKVVAKGGAAEVSQITVFAPLLTELAPALAVSGGTLVIGGQYFGGGPQKPRIMLTGTQRRPGKVLAGFTDSRLEVKLPRLKPGSYQVAVKTLAGTSNLLSFQIQ